MGYLAISIDDATAVAVHRRDGSVDPIVFETTTDLYFAEDGTVGLGADPQRVDASTSGPEHSVVAASISRVGRPTSDTDVYIAEDLVAHAVNCLFAMATGRHGGVAPDVAVVVPDGWGPRENELLLGSLEHTGLHGVVLMRESTARSAFDSIDPGAAGSVTEQTALAIGALAVMEGAGSSPDSANTDALPIVASPRALAFSEAIHVPYADLTAAEEDTPSNSRRSRPLLVVTGIAAAVILGSVGIAAALGTFSDGAEVSPPSITDAQSPAPTSTAAPATAPAVAIPFPTTEPAPQTEEQQPEPQVPASVAPPVEPPPTTAVPPPPAAPSAEATVVPDVAAPTTSLRFGQPGYGVPDYLQPGYTPPPYLNAPGVPGGYR